jgi:hypothetical protein
MRAWDFSEGAKERREKRERGEKKEGRKERREKRKKGGKREGLLYVDKSEASRGTRDRRASAHGCGWVVDLEIAVDMDMDG